MNDFAVAEEYVRNQRALGPGTRTHEFRTLLHRLRKLASLPAGSRVCEIGVGSGWFLVNAALEGLEPYGVEINPELAALARERATEEGTHVRIEVGDIQTHRLPRDTFDLIVANSVLEHVPHWQSAVESVFAALKPGGLFYFDSTNKFALRSGEFPSMRFYGWLPYPIRRRIRIARQGPGIVASRGMDFHQFTYPALRRDLRRIGFDRVLDLYELLEPDDLNRQTSVRRLAMRGYKQFPLMKSVLTTFADGTYFFCKK